MAKREKCKPSLSGGTSWHNKSDEYRADALKKMREAGLVSRKGQTNEEYAKQNKAFREACELAGVEPTARQASKYRNQRGKAYLEGRV